MNRALLADLQSRRAYPSVTLLVNTTAGSTLLPAESSTILRLAADADRRLSGDVPTDVRLLVASKIRELVDAQSTQRSGQSLVICVSPEHAAAVHLSTPVEERLIIDDSFATRDLVADLNRTALYRVVTVSERKSRMFVGDRQRLVEDRSDGWPMEREESTSREAWSNAVAANLRSEQAAHPMPIVFAGVESSIRKTIRSSSVEAIGLVAGNHDRTGWVDLHNSAWPLVSDWLRTKTQRSMERLDEARSARRFAGGLAEIWPLAAQGRIETLVVEQGFSMAARIDEHGEIHEATDFESPDVIDDLVDEAIEAVLSAGGAAVFVDDGELAEHDRIAAVLRF
jgi:Bacterial archaeo-eukaryotic release factor family 3